MSMQNHLIQRITRVCARAILCTAISLLCHSYVVGQAQENIPNRGFQPAGSYALTDLENINTVNGNMMFNVPMASLPHGRGGSPGARVGAFYNSKLYDTQTIIKSHPLLGLTATSELIKSEEGGWRYGFEYRLELEDRMFQYSGGGLPPCPAPEQFQRFKLKMSFPDGSVHEFRPAGYTDFLNDGFFQIYPNGYILSCNPPYSSWTYGPITYYSTDGTYLRLVIEHDDETDVWDDNPWTLYFPDGQRVTFNEPGSLGQRFYDRNDNFTEVRSITYNGHPAHRIIDQVNRSIIVEYDNPYNRDYIRVSGVNDVQLQWTVHWANNYVVKTYSSGPHPDFNVELNIGHRVVQQIDLPSQAGALSYTFG